MTKRIYNAVGHGEQPSGYHDPGATGHGWTEQSAGDHIVARNTEVLRAAGFDVRSEAFAPDPNFVGTVKAANAWPAEAVVSAHHDWTGGIDGVGAFWYPGSTEGETLARTIVKALAEAGFPVVWSWVKARGDLYLLRETRMPAVLIEYGRIGSPLLDTPDELRKAGAATARGIASWSGVTLNLGTATPAPPVRHVVTTAYREPDVEWARMIGLAHGFAFVEPQGDGGWVQVYPDGRRVPVRLADDAYALAVGWRASNLVGRAGAGEVIAAPSREGTRARTVEVIRRPDPNRRPPLWP